LSIHAKTRLAQFIPALDVSLITVVAADITLRQSLGAALGVAIFPGTRVVAVCSASRIHAKFKNVQDIQTPLAKLITAVDAMQDGIGGEVKSTVIESELFLSSFLVFFLLKF